MSVCFAKMSCEIPVRDFIRLYCPFGTPNCAICFAQATSIREDGEAKVRKTEATWPSGLPFRPKLRRQEAFILPTYKEASNDEEANN